MLKVVPPLAKVRDIRSAPRRRALRGWVRDVRRNDDSKVIDLHAYRGGKIIHFPRQDGPPAGA
ncbi:hypothetical protein [Acrocarpospora catenulata]|uniref:hypothetical protein n=1 Tax=Acrocarpospora catenulata TaxID=2836182 RepID=UPI001BDABD53|nr:hypothetical protein [Acrocarpospora catenulata]